MGVKQIIYSDITNEDIPDDEHHARIVVNEHPDIPFPVELDVTTEEAEKFQQTALRLVTLTVYAPDQPPRKVTLETKILDRLFDKVDMNAVLESARRAEAPQSRQASVPAATRQRRQPIGGMPTAKAGDKRNYKDPEYAGLEHRGICTEEEKEFVRNNLDKANANRAREGQPPITPNDEKMKRRYGF